MKRLLFEDYLNKVTKDELYKIYITENRSGLDTAAYFGITTSMLSRILRYYEINKPKDLHTANIKKIKLDRYGNSNYNNQSKRAKTNIEKYGVDNQFKRQNLMDEVRKANEAKYGSKNNIYKNLQTRIENSGDLETSYKNQVEKIKQTVKLKYGTDWASKSNIVKDSIRESLKETFLEKYGCENYWTSENAKRSNGSKNSKANINFEAKLQANSISYEKEFLLEGRYYDFKVENFLIEIDPTATHNATWSPWCKDHGIDKYYHADKTDIAVRNGYQCIHIWDWDDQDKIINTFLKKKPVIGARKCTVKLIDAQAEADYLNKHHFQGYTKSDVALALVYNDEIVMLMTFGKPRYSKKYQWELIRLCGSAVVVGGSEKLFSYFIENYNPDSIVSYCDLSKFEGNVYINLDFKKISRAIGRHWYNIKLQDHITDKLLFKRGFDALLGKTFGCYGTGTSNEELMLAHNFVEVYDCGQVTYVWKA